MKLNANTRLQLNPYDAPFYVLCEKLYVAGVLCKFGDQLPDFLDIHTLHTHFNNGVVGTKDESENLNAPVRLSQDDLLSPIAWFVDHPDTDEQVEGLNPNTEDSVGNVFSVENAKLLKTKDDLIGYAKEFGIELIKASNISMAKMLVTLEEKAKELNLLAK